LRLRDHPFDGEGDKRHADAGEGMIKGWGNGGVGSKSIPHIGAACQVKNSQHPVNKK